MRPSRYMRATTSPLHPRCHRHTSAPRVSSVSNGSKFSWRKSEGAFIWARPSCARRWIGSVQQARISSRTISKRALRLALQHRIPIKTLVRRPSSTESWSRLLPPRRAAARATFQKKDTIHLANVVPQTEIRAAEPILGSSVPAPIRPPASQRPAPHPTRNWHLIAFVLLPFATGFYLSYLFRTINALISSQLTSDLALGAADLGLLTSVYFLTFAAAQVPIGVLLDRYGPRRVQSALLLIAAAGAALFGRSQGFIPLIIARAMIGLGVASAMTAGLKAIVLWFPRERVALINGYMIMLGAMGAVTATAPAERLLDWIGWRGLFELLATATAISALLIYFIVPEPVSVESSPKTSGTLGLKAIYTDSRFWKLAPLSATCAGSAWALQGLWAAPWLTDVEGLERASVITDLFVMAIALSVGALLLGTVADRMRRRGVAPQGLLAVAATLLIAAQLALILRLPLPPLLPWSIVALLGSGTVLSYAILAEYFPKEAAGRANGALNVLHFGWAFIVQYATGIVLEYWPSHDGHHPAIAFQIAFSFSIAFQVAALTWFEWTQLRALGPHLASRAFGGPTKLGDLIEPITPYQKAMCVWTERLISARLQTRTWRFVALGSTGLCVVLGLALAISVGRAGVTPHVLEVEHLIAAGASNPPVVDAPSDAQIAYFLARFVKNVRSLSSDPIVVRANWLDAFGFATDRGAQALNDYVRDANPFVKVGSRSVTVEVIYVLRASNKSFEFRWREDTYEHGKITKIEHYTGIAQIVIKPTNATAALANPLGLYVHAFTWARDNES